MVVCSINEQNRPEEIRRDIPLRSRKTENSFKKDIPQSQEGERRVQKCVPSTPGTRGKISTDYYEQLAWMWDTQDVVSPPHSR